jgi:LacI family transcriptional regulator
MKGGLISNPFYADVLHGVEQTCRELRLNLLFSSLDVIDGHLRSLPPAVKENNISGVILLGALPKDVVNAIITFFKRPIVLVDNSLAHSYYDTVMIDNITGMHLAIEHLISKGHQHIALLSGPDHPSIVERRCGYQMAMQQWNLSPVVIAAPGLEPEDGEWGILHLLQEAPETTAIVCSNDFQAIGALRKLNQLGYRVPDSFSLVGFDDITLAQFTSPPLTTIQVDREMLGQMGVRLLLDRVRAPARTAIKTTLGVKLIERSSVAPPRTQSDGREPKV